MEIYTRLLKSDNYTNTYQKIFRDNVPKNWTLEDGIFVKADKKIYSVNNFTTTLINKKSQESKSWISSDFCKGIKCVIKKPIHVKQKEHEESLVRSYVIATQLAKLDLPNFQIPLGLYFDKENSTYTSFYNYIHGKTLEETISELSFSDFLEIFIQLLVALEVAQEKLNFCHYDFHLNNIILEKVKEPFLYNVEFLGEKFPIKVHRWVPKIIDYGLSCIKIPQTRTKFIGCKDFVKYGMFPFPLQGVDVYKFLFHSYVATQNLEKKELGKGIFSLLKIYGKDDPYKLREIKPDVDLHDISTEFLKLASFSKVAQYTPLDVLVKICKKNISPPKDTEVENILKMELGEKPENLTNLTNLTKLTNNLSHIRAKRWLISLKAYYKFGSSSQSKKRKITSV